MADVDALFADSGSEDEDDMLPRARVAAPASPSGSDGPAPPKPPPAVVRLMRDDEEDDEDVSRPVRDERPTKQYGPPVILDAPLLPAAPETQQICLVKLSNILGIDTRPFNPATFQQEEDSYTDEAGNQRVRLKDQNTIRWREKQLPDGSIGRESNARFVRWSDGSLQLLLGDEVMDVAQHDMTSDNNFLFVRHPSFIQGQGALEKKMAFRPASLNSKFHKRLTAKIDVRYTKTTKVRRTFTVADPAREKQAKEKAEEERIRSKEMLGRRQEASMRKYGSAVRRPWAGAMGGGITAEYLEAGEDEADYDDDDDLTATERARDALTRNRRTDERAEREAERRLAEAKRQPPPRMGGAAARGPKRRREDSESEEPEVSDDSDEEVAEESDEEPVRKPVAKRQTLVLSDSD